MSAFVDNNGVVFELSLQHNYEIHPDRSITYFFFF